jgi:hypothetical protein
MIKSYKNHEKKLENELRKTSKQDSKTFWKILNRFGKKGTDKNIKITIDQLYEYFKSLNEYEELNTDEINLDELLDNIDNQDIIDILDQDISEEEILLAVKYLNNGKAPGEDDIIKEYIKSTVNQFLPVHVNLFNLIFSSGIIPDSWLVGIIKPIYKNKGNPNNLDNYRAICLTSNMEKLFTSLLNSRLNKLSDDIGLISGVQGREGEFRKGYSVQDSFFVMHSLISLYLSSGKQLFCAFVDLKKAFDTEWRIVLWQKLIKNKIGGKM